MIDIELKNLVLNTIREINKDHPAEQGEIFKALGITEEELVVVLNSLNDDGEINFDTERKNKGLDNRELKFLSFGHITANWPSTR